MQKILEKLSTITDFSDKEKIYEVIVDTKRHDVMLHVMKCFPTNEDLILTLAEHIGTVSDYEYAKNHLDMALVWKFSVIILDKLSRINVVKQGDNVEYCSVIRSFYGPDHPVTHDVEKRIGKIKKTVEKFNKKRCSLDEFKKVIYYLCGTIEGTRQLYGSIYQINDKNLYIMMIDAGDMLDEAIKNINNAFYSYNDRIELIYKIAERIDPQDMLYSYILYALRYLPNAHDLHLLIAEKQTENVATSIYELEKSFRGAAGVGEILEILKKKL